MASYVLKKSFSFGKTEMTKANLVEEEQVIVTFVFDYKFKEYYFEF